MKKRISFILFCLISFSAFMLLSIEITQAKDMSGTVLHDSDYLLDNTHRGYLNKLIWGADNDGLLEIVHSAPQSYSYFTPTGDSIRVRKGPGLDYGVNFKAHKNEPENPDFPGDFPMSVLGGIVGNTVYKGDENCSKWQEIIAINAGSHKFQGLDIIESIGDGGNYPNYICSDFIQTESVDPYLEEWFDSKFRISSIASQYIFDELVDVNNTVIFPPDYPAFVETVINPGDKIVFASFFYDGMMDEEVKIYKMLDDMYAVQVGSIKVGEIESKLKLNETGIQTLKNFVLENERLKGYY